MYSTKTAKILKHMAVRNYTPQTTNNHFKCPTIPQENINNALKLKKCLVNTFQQFRKAPNNGLCVGKHNYTVDQIRKPITE